MYLEVIQCRIDKSELPRGAARGAAGHNNQPTKLTHPPRV